MRTLLTAAMAALFLVSTVQAEDQSKEAPKVVLRSPDGKKSYDLDQLTAAGPVLVRLTCACSGCDQELPFFQKLQAAYDGKGLKTLAVFREKAEDASNYVLKKNIQFMWLEDPKGELWKTFDATIMPTNILIDKGGKVVKIVSGCTKDGKNAQIISSEVAKLLKTPEVRVAEGKSPPK